jgi:hypothetical protein
MNDLVQADQEKGHANIQNIQTRVLPGEDRCLWFQGLRVDLYFQIFHTDTYYLTDF